MENNYTKNRSTQLSKVGRYSLSRTIGRGNFAVVKLGKHEITKTKVAVKIIDKCRLKEENLRKIYREIQILKILKHRHIIRLYQVMETDQKLFLVTEFASGGEVFDYLRKHSRMNEREARQVFRQVVSAVAYCHTMGVVHRDLKAENLLFANKNNIKLIDFGFSNFYNEDSLLQTWCGSPPYAAPELFLGESYDGAKADIWSLGVVLYILVCGGFPFPSTSIDRLRHAVLDGHINIPFYVSAECADLIKKMLVVDPKQRYNIKQVIQHRWFYADDWNEEMDALFRASLDPRATCEMSSTLNHSCIIYMQQKGYSSDKIVESITEKRFDDEYATYYLLCDKLFKRNLPIFNLSLNDVCNGIVTNGGSGSRRGSRGSLTTGQATMDSSMDTPTISTADLVKLGLSSGDEDSVSSDSECSSAAPSTINMQNYLSQRRHTALGVPGLNATMFPQPSASGNVGIVAAVPFPLVGNLGELSNLANPLMSLLKPPPFLPNLPPTNGARRSGSLGNSTNPFMRAMLDPLMFVGGPLKTCNSYEQPSTSSKFTCRSKEANEENGSVDEMGARYLKARGNLKRHTIHGTAAAGDSPTRSNAASAVGGRHYSSMSGGGGYLNNCRSRCDPYRTPSLVTRRASDTANNTTPGYPQLPPDILSHLEKLYSNATQNSDTTSVVENMRHLQQEFQQLRATTEMLQSSNPDIWRNSPRASPPTQCLDMIAEHDNDEPSNCQESHNNHNVISSPLSLNSAIFAQRASLTASTLLPPLECTPRISVTDDYGTTYNIHNRQAQTNDDPLTDFHMYTNDLLCNQVTIPQPTCLINQQQTCLDNNYYYSQSPTSTTIFALNSLRALPDVCAQLKYVLDSMSDVTYRNLDDLSSTSVVDVDSTSRRVSLKSDDGTEIEIDVTDVGDYQSTGGVCRVEFRCVEGDINRYERLCTQVLSGLNL